MSAVAIDKRAVAASFSRAASTYDQVAELQRQVGSNLLARLPESLQPCSLVDLGCGTGYFTRALNARFGRAVMGLDIAEGMLRYARAQGPEQAAWITADAEALPLRDGSQDLLFSSLALQWCPDLGRALSEARRVLRPGGCMAFNTLVEGTLGELRGAWSRWTAISTSIASCRLRNCRLCWQAPALRAGTVRWKPMCCITRSSVP